MNMSIPTMYPQHPMPPHNYQSYYQPTMAVTLPLANPIPEPLRPNTCHLEVRQQPREALVTVKGKEKFRKPVDPPPILQLKLNDSTNLSVDFLQNPYIFVSASLWKADRDEPVEHTPNDSLAGTLVSSLHRLKDIDNKDGGFFVFGDISVRIQGSFRLYFTMYEFQPSQGEFQFLGSQTSEKFDVVLPKDFKGLEESTYLSRAFSDQGVRLRLRKEARGMMKRAYASETESTTQAPIAPSYEYQSTKRRREDYVLPPTVDTPQTSQAPIATGYEYQPTKRRREDYILPPNNDAPPMPSYQPTMNPYAPAPFLQSRISHHPAYHQVYNTMAYPMVPQFDQQDDGSWDHKPQ
jgi:hypothetical protein